MQALSPLRIPLINAAAPEGRPGGGSVTYISSFKESCLAVDSIKQWGGKNSDILHINAPDR
jgi:hypothetical protein